VASRGVNGTAAARPDGVLSEARRRGSLNPSPRSPRAALNPQARRVSSR
jgi:hypothetical protein